MSQKQNSKPSAQVPPPPKKSDEETALWNKLNGLYVTLFKAQNTHDMDLIRFAQGQLDAFRQVHVMQHYTALLPDDVQAAIREQEQD